MPNRIKFKCKFFNLTADYEGSPLATLAAASTILFFNAEKHINLGKVVNPTLSSFIRSLGKSYIIHSNLVGLLNLVFVSSAYFGLTNSGIKPPLFFKAAR